MNALCPYCKSRNLIKYGKTKQGRSRFLCKTCNKSFINRTQTIFNSTKLKKEKLEPLVKLILRDANIKTICDVLNITSRTAYIWRIKFYKAFSSYQKNVVLNGKVWIDETFIPLNKSLITTNNGKKLRGQSRNQIVICAGVDSHNNSIAFVAGRGHITSSKCLQVYGPHIQPKSTLHHDGIFSHDKLVKSKELVSIIHKSIVKTSRKGMKPIDHFCSMIKRNQILHIGSKSCYIQDYLNWVVFKKSLKGLKIKDKIAKSVAFCFQSGIRFRVKDRYNLRKSPTLL